MSITLDGTLGITSPAIPAAGAIGGTTPAAGAFTTISASGAVTISGTLTGGATLFSPITNALTANVALNNTANFFTGPSVAQGSVGTWLAMGTITVGGGSTSVMAIKIWDGTTVLASSTFASLAGPGANGYGFTIIGKPITNPAGNIRISVRDLSNTDNFILYDERSLTLSSSITAIRIG